MKRYSLLRNNREAGPFTLRELKTLGLVTTDLVWIENESVSWTYPTDIDELKAIASKGIKVSLATEKEKPTIQLEENKPTDFTFHSSPASNYHTNATTEDFSAYLTEKEKPIEWKPQRQKRSMAEISSSFFGLGVLLIGVVMCAFVVKKLVEQFDIEQPLFSAEAVEIKSETLPVSTTASMAKATQINTASTLPVLAAEDAPVEVITSSVSKEVAKEEVPKNPQQVAETATKLDADETQKNAVITTAAMEETVPPVKEEKPVEKLVKKASVNLAATDYKIGVFGGVSEFELAVSNPSEVSINKAVVEVEYLKPNGNVVKSQTLSVENIGAGSAKTIQVPASSRGVKVRYRVVSLEAAE